MKGVSRFEAKKASNLELEALGYGGEGKKRKKKKIGRQKMRERG